MALRVKCNNNATIYNLTHSQEVEFGDHCTIYKIIQKRDIKDNMLTNIVLRYDIVSMANSSEEIETNVGTINKNEIKTIIDMTEKIDQEIKERENSPGFFGRTINKIKSFLDIDFKLKILFSSIVMISLMALTKKLIKYL